MSARYSIIQYVPDVIINERINIGVIAFDQTVVRVRFLTRWERVQRFAGQDIGFLKVFAHDLADAASPALLLLDFAQPPQLNATHIETMASRWSNTIQVTEPRASLQPVDDLLNDIAARFLSEPARTRRVYRDRRAAASVATSQIRQALTARVGSEEAEGLLKPKSPLQGRHQSHTFDAVVANGIPYLAAHGISFELPEARELHSYIDAVAWSIKDVRDFDQTLPIGVMALPPREDTEERVHLNALYEQTVRVYSDLGASVLTEQDIEQWAARVVQRIPITQ